MEKTELKDLLKDYDLVSVENFVNYCYKLTTEKDKD